MFVLPVSPPTKKERIAINIALMHGDDPTLRERVYQACKADVAWFVNMFGWTFDPRPTAPNHHIPFILYDFQIESLRWFDARIAMQEDGIVEKSRDMGVTWITVAFLVHKWLFEDGFQGLFGSRTEDLVDNWTLDSHFGKIEYFVDRLPGWFMPRGFDMDTHRMKLKLTNPENGNVIMGQSANAQFSRQGRYTIVIFDEAAFWENLESPWRAAGAATTTRIAISTPNMLDYFYGLRESGMYKVLTLHVTRHPSKDEEWREKQKGRMSAEDYAQEIDISYHRSVRGIVYPGFKNVPLGEYPYERKKNMPLWTTWDFGIGDNTCILWIAKNPETGKFRIVDFYQNHDVGIEFYVPFILGFIPPDLDEEYTYTFADREKIAEHGQFPRTINFGDSDVNKRNLGDRQGRSVADVLREHGIHIAVNTNAVDFLTRKSYTERGIREIEGINTPECNAMVDALNNARFPQRRPGSQSTSATVLPVHDWTEAPRSALEYFFVNVPATGVIQRKEPTRRKMAYDTFSVR